jgi:tRNA A-37 threonylcarbamoyl transferase component Bud32
MFASIRVISGSRVPRGYQQITSISSATGLTVPVVANIYVGYAVIQCEYVSGGTNGVSVARWRDDGTNPTNTVGMQIASGQEMDYSGDLTTLKFIDGSGVSQINISYYS